MKGGTAAHAIKKMIFLKARKKILRRLCGKLYVDNQRDIERSVLVAGTARSGTTWLADIISSQIPCRIMFEPFHSRKVKEFGRFPYFQYMRPEDEDHDLYCYCKKVLSGDIRHPWIDREVEHIFPRYRVIKEIRANLFLKWFADHFNCVPVLFMLRHPCAVVLSRMEASWSAEMDIESFLSQPKLIDDFLKDKLEIIRDAGSLEQRHAIVWCVTNLVPLRQFRSGALSVVFYENLCLRPDVQIPMLFRSINHEYQNDVFEYAKRPSITALSSSSIMTGEDQVGRWKKKLSTQQIDRILAIARAFGLGHVYGESLAPVAG